jgi:formylglycine-generating enzyme required for sulfatase activity
MIAMTLPGAEALVVEIGEFEKRPAIASVALGRKAAGLLAPLKLEARHYSTAAGGKSFPFLRELKLRLNAGPGAVIIHSHLIIRDQACGIAAADEAEGVLLRAADFAQVSGPILLLAATPAELNAAAFATEFAQHKGLVIATADARLLDEAGLLISSKLRLLQWAEGKRLILAGRAASISDAELTQARQASAALRAELIAAGGGQVAMDEYAAGLLEAKQAERLQGAAALLALHRCDETWEVAFVRCLQKRLDERQLKLGGDDFRKLSHPSWTEYENLRQPGSRESLKKADVLLSRIHAELCSDLIRLADSGSGSGDWSSCRHFTDKLMKLDPSQKLRRGYPGRIWTEPVSGISFAWVPAGKALIGSPKGQSGAEKDEILHEIEISRPVLMAVTEITEEQWARVMGSEGIVDRRLPRSQVSWKEASAFCKRLGELSGCRVRLPSEVEWEWACRAGSKQIWSFGDSLSPRQAAVSGPGSAGKLLPAGSFPANAWGLKDMHGSLWEWCSDWAAPYQLKQGRDPRGPDDAQARRDELDMRICRGGSWKDPASSARSANRWEYSPSVHSDAIGFRIIIETETQTGAQP